MIVFSDAMVISPELRRIMLHLRSISKVLAATALLAVMAVACLSDDGGVPAAQDGAGAVTEEYVLAQQFDLSIPVTSTKFNEERRIPRKYSCTQEDVSVPITWGEIPEGTVSMALLVESNQAPGPMWAHWLLWGIPPDARGLPEAIPNTPEVPSIGPNTGQGTNNDNVVGWSGPCPPAV